MCQLSPLYLLESFDVGIVHLDAQSRVISMNELARRTLPVEPLHPFGQGVLSFHPPRSQPKVQSMLDQAASMPKSHAPLMTMIINIPERVLLIKVSSLSDFQGQPAGYTLVLCDMTDLVSAETPASDQPNARRRRRGRSRSPVESSWATPGKGVVGDRPLRADLDDAAPRQAEAALKASA